MNLRVNRFLIGTEGIVGRLMINGLPQCYTLENRDLAIPPGEYPVTFYDSPKHGPVPLIQGVPGRDFIEMHIANYPKELLGCIALGLSHGNDYIEASKDACNAVFPILKSAIDGHDPVTLVVH